MMAFKRFEHEGCISYLVGDDESMTCAVIDPHLDPGPYLQAARDLGMEISLAIDTHSHADHRSGSAALREAAGAQVVMGQQFPAQRLASKGKGGDFGIADTLKFNSELKVDRTVVDGDLVEVGETSLLVQETPGHTIDALTLLGSGRAFTGDALMVGQVGRPDLPGGDANALYSTLQKLKGLSDELMIYPAHDYAGNVNTSLGYEKRHNQFLLAASEDEFLRMVAQQFPSPQQAEGKLQCGVQEQYALARAAGAAAAPGGSLRDAMCVAMEAIFPQMPKDWSVVSPKALYAATKAKDRPLVLDVRTPQEFAGGRVEDAVNIPVRDLPQRMDELPMDRNAPIVAMCQSGNRSAYAAMYLRAAGYTNAKSLDYGMTGWEAEGLPVVRPKTKEVPAGAGTQAGTKTAQKAEKGRAARPAKTEQPKRGTSKPQG